MPHSEKVAATWALAGVSGVSAGMDQLLALIIQAIAEKVAPAIVEETKRVARAQRLEGAEAPDAPEAPAPTASTREVLTTQEAAQLLGVHPKSLERMRAQGKGPKYVRIGKAIRYRRSDLG